MEYVGALAVAMSAMYCLAALAVLIGIRRSTSRSTYAISTPFVSVVVAARNEEDTLPNLLETLRAQDYPADRWEVIVVDDRSTDRTSATVTKWQTKISHLRLVRVDTTSTTLGGKQHALSVAIGACSGEIVLMTDADCTVPPTWIRAMVAPFTDQRIGIASGPVRFPKRDSLWVHLQRADLAHLLAAEWGAIGLGIPISAIGNNLAIRRAAYDEIGGYATLEPTIVEDCAILQRVAQTGRWKVAVTGSDSTIETEPVTTGRAFLRQRARWSTGAFLVTRSQLVFLVAVFLQRVATVAATLLAAFGALRTEWAFAAWGLWIGSDALAIWRYARFTNQRRLVFLAPLVTLWQAIYQPIAGLWALLLPGTISWKGRRSATR